MDNNIRRAVAKEIARNLMRKFDVKLPFGPLVSEEQLQEAILCTMNNLPWRLTEG